MNSTPFRWGILGLGHIARSFAWGLRECPDAQLAAGASRSRERADIFQREFDVPRCYASYEELYADPEIDAIYIATRHPDHACAAIAAIEAGKPVLVEKPFTVNSREAKTVVDAARRNKVFCMEAMWSRFLPLMGRLRDIVAQGDIGDVRAVQADFSFRSEFDPESRIFDPAKGGGALLDVGVYPISFASMLLGRPAEAVGLAHIGQTGVDEAASLCITYGQGRLASLSCGTRARSQHEAFVVGTEGRIQVHSQWWMPRSMTICRPEREDERIDVPYTGNGYNYEASEVMRCVRAGLTESAILPLDETLDVMRTMDTLRRQWGLRYEADQHPG
ncbi:MAG: Gfo/Idh/MocA family protein [Candidatus Sumerlaeaceae bacterium]